MSDIRSAEDVAREWLQGFSGLAGVAGPDPDCPGPHERYAPGERDRRDWCCEVLDLSRFIERDRAEVRADGRAKVLAGFTEEWAVASDIAATVIPMPPTLARKVAALGVDARVVSRHVGPWMPVGGDEG